MLNYPLSVFIDTNIFVGCKYDLSEHIDDGYHKVNKVKFCPDCGQALKWE